MSKSNPYTIHFTEEERKLYDEFAEKQNYNTLSRLIKEALEVVIRNPSLLKVTEVEPDIKLEESIKVFLDGFERKYELESDLLERMVNLERMMEQHLLDSGLSKKDLKERQGNLHGICSGS